MNRVVLDASALLAILNQEPGAETLTPELLNGAAISTVNLAEVHGKLVGRGLRPDDAWEAALSPIREAIPFTSEHARPVGDLVAQTRPVGSFLIDEIARLVATDPHGPDPFEALAPVRELGLADRKL